MPASPPIPDLSTLLASWTVHLRAERKSPQTVKSYTAGVRQFLDWCTAEGVPAVLERASVNAFIAGLLDSGAEAATARARQLALRRFSAWCTEEGEIVRDELLGLKPPKLDVKVVPRLTDEQCRALVKACTGREFRDRRDEAIVRFMLEAIVRAGEVVAMRTTDVDLTRGIAVVQRGKGGKDRPVPFGAQTGRAIDRYLRLRRAHRLADTAALWLGDLGARACRMTACTSRSSIVPSLLASPTSTHTSPGTPRLKCWLSAEGSEGGLMAVAGWTRRDMIDHYTRATAAERAAEEARRLDLGDF